MPSNILLQLVVIYWRAPVPCAYLPSRLIGWRIRTVKPASKRRPALWESVQHKTRTVLSTWFIENLTQQPDPELHATPISIFIYTYCTCNPFNCALPKLSVMKCWVLMGWRPTISIDFASRVLNGLFMIKLVQ